jgi:hypothetical protein
MPSVEVRYLKTPVCKMYAQLHTSELFLMKFSSDVLCVVKFHGQTVGKYYLLKLGYRR